MRVQWTDRDGKPRAEPVLNRKIIMRNNYPTDLVSFICIYNNQRNTQTYTYTRTYTHTESLTLTHENYFPQIGRLVSTPGIFDYCSHSFQEIYSFPYLKSLSRISKTYPLEKLSLHLCFPNFLPLSPNRYRHQQLQSTEI